MKKTVIITVILILLTSLAACEYLPTTPLPAPPTIPPTATASPVPPTPTETLVPTATTIPPLNSQNGPPLISINMITPLNGWGIVENQLLLTNDGGFTWAGVPVPGGPFNGFNSGTHFVNDIFAMVLVPAPDGQTGLLNITRDRGQTWESVPVPAPHGKLQFVFNTDLEAFILTNLGAGSGSMPVALYQTLDQVTWERTFAHTAAETINGLPFLGIKSGMYFVSPSVGWITGTVVQENYIYAFQTGDAGRNWQQMSLNPPNEVGNYMAEAHPPIFFEGSRGFLMVDFLPTDGSDPVRGVYFSPDTGQTWSLVSTLPGGSAFQFIDAATGWTWAGRQLYFTADGALTWNILPVAFSSREDVTWIDFIDANNGWIITVDDKSRVRLYRTLDGGNTWAVVIP